MSKRPRAAAGTGRGKKAATPAVEVISLLDDSSQSEDDPDDAAVQARPAELQPAAVAARPSKRLRRMDAAEPPAQQHTAAPAAAAAKVSGVQSSARQQQQLPQPADEAPASQRAGPKLRQATLPVAKLRPRTTALPLQSLNVSRPRAGGTAFPATSGDSALVGGASPAPSASPSPLSQRSSRLSQDPDFMPASQSLSHGGASQPPASQQQHQGRQQPARPQLRQLTFAPARTGGAPGGTATAAAAGNKALPFGGAGGGSSGGRAAAVADRPAARSFAPAAGPSGSGAPGSGGSLPTTTTTTAAAASSSRLACPTAEMWYERHAPTSEDDLVQVLHRKKVSELKDWLEHQRQLIAQAAAAAAAAPPQTQKPLAYATQSQQHQQHFSQHGGWQQQQQRQSSQAWHRGGSGAGGGGGGPVGPGFRSPWRQCGLAVLSGPAGCGKSACLRVLAEATGFEVVEWTPPPPVMWNEYQYQRSGGGGEYGSGPPASYQSKLDDFESFVSRSKYPSLALTAAATVAGAGHGGGSQPPAGHATRGSAPTAAAGAPRPKLLLVEDLPHTHDAERRQRLAAALRDLAACARGPVVLVAIEAEGQAAGGGGGGGRGGGDGGGGGGGSMGGVKGLHKDILAALQSAGAVTIGFNPVTANNIAKLLMRVAAAEGLDLAPAAAVGLAEAADGDVRSALQALQMNAMLQKAALRGAAAAAGGGGGGRRKAAAGGKGGGKARGKAGGGGGASATALLRAGRQQALTAGEVARMAAAQRDLGLPLFHALGKFLYNKRGGTAAQGGEGDGDSDGEIGGGGGSAAAAAGTRGRGGGGGGGGSKDKREKDSVALRQLNAHSLTAGRQWKLQQVVQLPPRLLRPPMRYDPEAILLRCGLEAPVLLSFLHENYPGFVDGEAEDAVDDVASVAAYLSDGAVLCGQSRAASATAATSSGGTSLWLEDSPAAANLSSAIAASVAARGLMYGNTHPAPHRFNPIRAPASSAIDQAAAANRLQLRAAACRLAEAGGGGGRGAAVGGGGGGGAPALLSCSGGSASQLVSSVMPWLRSLTQTSPHHAVWLAPLLPGSWSYYWNGAVTEGAFLRRVAAPPPPQFQQPQFQQQRGGAAFPQQQQQGGGVEGMLEQLDLEDEDPIEG
ncbi:hypothetical protein PLESTB_000437100 [Pleodorina starrii]|uniref:Cell cycle checkpoint protein RAD17 n=1 Tax=Pleodorina starrii TaxID=330485 RepID=A0A9W6EZP7_9CHLO|nr:hypothetical protein PLESTB_000437100 [Pleodorina starrii]GLC73972.1 hypothetical protein PLESTF_001443400 [Pleodorina starrii]